MKANKKGKAAVAASIGESKTQSQTADVIATTRSGLAVMCAGLFVLAVVTSWEATKGGLIYDDIKAVEGNPDLRPTTPIFQLFLNDFWGTPIDMERSHKSYRPLTVLTYRLNYALHELEPFGYHLGNVLLHGMTTVLAFLVGMYTLPSLRCSFLAGLLFAVHPIHTEAVCHTVGRADVLCMLFIFLAYLMYLLSTNATVVGKSGTEYVLSFSTLMSLVFYTCAFLSKGTATHKVIGHVSSDYFLCAETGITFAGMVVVSDLLRACQRSVSISTALQRVALRERKK